jgi:hypothetical protein
MERLEDVPRELILQLLKYTNQLGPKLYITDVSYSIDTRIYKLCFNVINEHKSYKTTIAFTSKSEYFQYITEAAKLNFNVQYTYICSIENNAFLVHRGKYSFVFPLDRYGETISSQFQKIAKELDIKDV